MSGDKSHVDRLVLDHRMFKKAPVAQLTIIIKVYNLVSNESKTEAITYKS